MSEKTNPDRPYPGIFKKEPTSKNWTIDYYRADGKRVKESTKTDNLTRARAMLRERQGQKDRGEVVETRAKVADLYAELEQHVKANAKGRGSRSPKDLAWRWKHLSPVFAHLKVAQVTTKSVTAYTVQRQEEGAAEATINRELATLRRMLNFGKQSNRVKVVP